MSSVTDRQKTVSLRSLRKHVAVHDGRIDALEQHHDRLVTAVRGLQMHGEWLDIQREAGDAALDARLRVHRCELDALTADVRTALWMRLDAVEQDMIAFESLTFLGRLRWLLTGKV
jgi:hypothetical protein